MDSSFVYFFMTAMFLLLCSSYFVAKRPFRDNSHCNIKYYNEDGEEMVMNKKGKFVLKHRR
jgi:hypothetical protein